MSQYSHITQTRVLAIGGSHTRRKFRVSYGMNKPENTYFIRVYISGQEDPILDETSTEKVVGHIISLGMILNVPMHVLEKMSKLEDI